MPFTPYRGDERTASISKSRTSPVEPGSSLPMPPEKLRLDYGTTAEQYHRSGLRDTGRMRELLAAAGRPVEKAERVLELGCAAGRMLRGLEDVARTSEVWGVDTTAARIAWCKENLSPPFHFATTTLVPHLPFEDRYFGLVYAGSVFTHIDDLADAWFQEVRRVLRPGGVLYATIADRHSLRVLEGGKSGHWFARLLASAPEARDLAASDFGMFSIADRADRPRSNGCEVVYDADWLLARLAPFYRALAVTPEAYGYQTGLVLERS